MDGGNIRLKGREGGERLHMHLIYHDISRKMTQRHSSKPKAQTSANYWDQFHLLAIGSCSVALFGVLALTISLPILYSQMDSERSNIWAKSQKFKADSNRVWALLQPWTVNESRNKRSPSAEISQRAFNSACGCSMLNCPQGPPGPPGPSGQDIPPGKSGNPGESGVDGLDIVVETELDLPCIVCPGGPPGQRGSQGERGMVGIAGSRGEEGIPGKEGSQGTRGSVGPRGNFGQKGKEGLVGIRGSQVVAGVGIKGPNGRPGSTGQMGPNGLPGSNMRGQTGAMGDQGPPGQMGDAGRPGEVGFMGHPGEGGMPSAYCPTDCGVSHIKVTDVEKMEETEKKEKKGRATKLLGIEEKGEIRRHPTGGYYRKQNWTKK